MMLPLILALLLQVVYETEAREISQTKSHVKISISVSVPSERPGVKVRTAVLKDVSKKDWADKKKHDKIIGEVVKEVLPKLLASRGSH